jgi:hypothetical protein
MKPNRGREPSPVTTFDANALRLSAGTAVTMLTTMALAGAGFGQSPRLINLGGLFQRASIITGFAWLTALSA